MITPYLESLIWSGKAVFRTFTAGGAEKSVLTVMPNSFIVIVGCTYFPRTADGSLASWSNNWSIQQLNIQSERLQTILHFRNSSQMTSNPTTGAVSPTGPGQGINIGLYLVHDKNVAFSFTDAEPFSGTVSGPTNPKGTGFQRPLEYGKSGIPGGVMNIVQTATLNSGSNVDYTGFRQGSFTYEGLKFNATKVASITGVDKPIPANLPLAVISYVEVSVAVPITLR